MKKNDIVYLGKCSLAPYPRHQIFVPEARRRWLLYCERRPSPHKITIRKNNRLSEWTVVSRAFIVQLLLLIPLCKSVLLNSM